MTEPVSRYFPDDVLRQILRACVQDTYEVWAEHPDYIGYQVSSWGRVYSQRSRKFLKYCWAEGYARVQMPGRRRKVHQLVLEAFIGPRPDGYEACHYDGAKENNRLMNLRWDTPEANRDDSRRVNYERKRAEIDGRNQQRRERLARVLERRNSASRLPALASCGHLKSTHDADD